MKKFRNLLIERALNSNARIVLPEQNDSRIVEAKNQLLQLGFNIIETSSKKNIRDLLVDFVSQKKFTKNWTYEQKYSFIKNPVNFGMAMVASNHADCLVAGAVTPTSDVLRSAIRIVGVKPTSKWISSSFFMLSKDEKTCFTFSDCGVIPEPTTDQLVNIAKDASQLHEFISSQTPKVAFLSFSTKGSANHYRVKRVKDATCLFSKKYPDITHEGEIQFDVAVDKLIASQKAPQSSIQGDANVMIFPNLDAGNIAYKITQRLAGFHAWGPLLQGLNKPVHDLSRGCSVDDIISICVISAIQKESYAIT